MMPVQREWVYALDPAAFSAAAGVAPDPWQANLLRSTAPRILVNCSRQSGKSTIAAILALHTALYTRDAIILLLSPSLRQSGELFRKTIEAYRAMDRPVSAEAETRLSLELENGSRIVSLPGTEQTIRGYSGVRLIVVDEASRVEDGLYHSVTPMLAVSGGRLIALSTPYGVRGWWYTAWRSADAWERYRVPATECPRIPADFLQEQRRSMGDWWFQQEYMCRFEDSQDSLFRLEDIEAAFAAGGPAWDW